MLDMTYRLVAMMRLVLRQMWTNVQRRTIITDVNTRVSTLSAATDVPVRPDIDCRRPTAELATVSRLSCSQPDAKWAVVVSFSFTFYFFCFTLFSCRFRAVD